MIRKLFSMRFITTAMFVLLACSVTSVVKAQIVIPTPTPSASYSLLSVGGTPINYITIDVRNDNPCPVALTALEMMHFGRVLINFGTFSRNVSTNDATYTLYATTLETTTPPLQPLSAAWKKVAVRDSVNTDTFNRIEPIFSGLDVYIPANGTARLLIQVSDTIVTPLNTAPLDVTVDGVTLSSGSTSQVYVGVFGTNIANAGSFPASITTLNWEGRISLKQLPPTPPDAAVALKPVHKCIGDSVILKATHPKAAGYGGIFTWRDKTGKVLSQNTSGDTVLRNLQPSDAGKYYVTYTQCGFESPSDSIVIIMNQPPAPTASGKFDYCLNEQFEPITVNGTNIKWYYDPTGGSPVPVTPTINTSSPNTLIYYVSQTDKYGCESAERTLIRFRAADKPAPPFVNSPIYYCENAVADQLTAIGDTLRWYYFDNGGVETVIPPTPNTSAKDSFQYYVTQTIDGCESDRSRIDVVVTFRPNGLILLDKNVICKGEDIKVSYYGSAYPSSQYNWTLPIGTTLNNGGAKDQGPFELTLDSAGTQEIKLRVGNTGCLSELYIEEIEVRPLPYGKIVTKHDVCLSQPELIEAAEYTPSLDTFIWDFGGGRTSHFTTEQGPYGVQWDTDGMKSISMTLVDSGCTSVIYDTITVHPKPSAKIVAEWDQFDAPSKTFNPVNFNNMQDTLCASDSLKVTVDVVEPGATYKWTPSIFFRDYSDEAVTYARVDFNSNIFVEVEDIYGCQNKDSMKVYTKSCCEMVFPNAFTPNGDGRNDRFRPITVGRRQIKTFQVLNRYGQVVYESVQAGIGWDGTMNGKKADLGTYSWFISFDCEGKNVVQSGDVLLMR